MQEFEEGNSLWVFFQEAEFIIEKIISEVTCILRHYLDDE